MRFLLIILFGVGVCAGCGRKLAPVSSNTVKTVQTDSTTNTKTSTDTTERYIEKWVRKILHGSTAATNINPALWDSLARVLRAMPKGRDTIYLTDPTQAVALKVYLDKIGQMQLACQSKDQEYFERHITDQRIIRHLRDSITKIRSGHTSETHTVVKETKGFFQNLRDALNNWLVLLVIVVWVKYKIKSIINKTTL